MVLYKALQTLEALDMVIVANETAVNTMLHLLQE